MFDRFEPAARQAVLGARAEAVRAGHDRVHAEHMLLGLFAEPGVAAEAMADAGADLTAVRARLPRGSGEQPAGLDADALATLGIDLDAVRRATDAAFGRDALERAPVSGRRQVRFAEDARQSLAGAVKQAHQLGQRTISSGHLLIGILDQDRNAGVTALRGAGVDTAALRADVLQRITPG